MKIPLASSGLRPKDIEAAVSVLNSGNLTMGKQVESFEGQMARYLGTKHFIMTNSGSSANLAIIEALMRPAKFPASLLPGDSVLVPAIAWPTTIWPLIQLGLNPVFVDIEIATLGLDLKKAQLAIDQSPTPVKGIFVIHPLGYSLDAEVLNAFCARNSLVEIHDVCESLGSFRTGNHAGTTGLAGSFSFYFSHHLTTMEGGGVATNQDSFADDIRSIRSHGWSRGRADSEFWTAGLPKHASKFLFVSTGYNIRPMEIQAAIGLSQIQDIEIFLQKRRHIAAFINAAISDTCLKLIGAEMLEPGMLNSHSWMLLPILVIGENSSARKEAIVMALEDLGIETRPVLTGNFLLQPSMQRIGKNLPEAESFVNATQITNSAFMVGAHHDLTDEQISYLANNLKLLGAIA